MSERQHFSYVKLPPRVQKPRMQGLTCVIDNGLPMMMFEDFVRSFHLYIDYVKFGWGTACVTPSLEKKLAILKEHHIHPWIGGTFMEIVYHQNQFRAYQQTLKAMGIKHIEISDGVFPIERAEKRALIEACAKDFTVFSEVGSKDVNQVMSPKKWIEQITEDFECGASMVITEGRESGKAGIYRETGEVRFGLVQEMRESGVCLERLIFEAPQKDQQACFVNIFGGNVNLANIAFQDILNLETLRQGLRNDTIHQMTNFVENENLEVV